MGSSCVTGKSKQGKSPISRASPVSVSKASTIAISKYGECEEISCKLDENFGFSKQTPQLNYDEQSSYTKSEFGLGVNQLNYFQTPPSVQNGSRLQKRSRLSLHKCFVELTQASTGIRTMPKQDIPTADSSPHQETILQKVGSLKSAGEKNQSIEMESQVSDNSKLSLSPKKKQRISYFERFIIERKKFMMENGIFVYNANTILPPPVLKSVQKSTIKKKREAMKIQNLSEKVKTRQVLEHRINVGMTQTLDIEKPYTKRKECSPTEMLSGDQDDQVEQIAIEI